MKIKALTTSFVANGNTYHKGDVFELEDGLAQLAIEAGCAELVDEGSDKKVRNERVHRRNKK